MSFAWQKITGKLGEIEIIYIVYMVEGIILLIYKELLKIEGQKTTSWVDKWKNNMNTQFTKQDVKMALKHSKKIQSIS